MFDRLKLLRGENYEVNQRLTIHHPTLDEIYRLGEQRYFTVASSLTATPSSYKSVLFDMGIDYEAISDFDFFYIMCRGLKQEDTAILLGEHDLSRFEMTENVETGEHVMVDYQTEMFVDEGTYFVMAEFLRKVHRFEKRVDKAADAATKKFMIEAERRKLEWMKNDKQESVLEPLISAMVNCQGFKYDHDTVWKLPIYTFYDSVSRIQKHENYAQVVQGCYAGTVKTDSVNFDQLSWLK